MYLEVLPIFLESNVPPLKPCAYAIKLRISKTFYLSEPSLSMRSLELVEAAPGDELKRLSDAPFVDSDSEFRDSILNLNIILLNIFYLI